MAAAEAIFPKPRLNTGLKNLKTTREGIFKTKEN